MARKGPGGEIVARMLAAEGVERVFGIIDGTYFGLYSSLPDVGIELISPRHETSAAHMAGAYARTTGKLGVCIASNGPGVANILPGVAVENGEGNRVLLITSSRRAGIGYPDRGGTFQYFDQVGVTRAMTKWSGHTSSRDRVPELLRRALRLSWRGRPGVVHLDIGEDVLNGTGPIDDTQIRAPHRYRRTTPLPPDPALVDDAAQALANATQPLIHAGYGVYHAGAEAELLALAERLEAPVTTSWAARGAIPETSRHAIPMTAVELVDRVRNDADVVLTVGSRIGETDWWGKPPNWAPPGQQTHIQVDLDEEIIGLNKPVDIAIQADAKGTLAALLDTLNGRTNETSLARRRDRLEEYAEARREEREKLDEALTDDREPLHPARVPATAQQVLPEDTIWVFDGGNTTVWANFFHEARIPRSVISTFKFGMLGAGVSQALGAKVAAPDRPVCCIIGDGAFGMHPQELETAVRHDLPVIYLVLADRAWGMVKMSQQIAAKPVKTVAKKLLLDRGLGEGETIYADFHEIEYDALARSMGAHGERVSRPADLAPAIERAHGAGRPAVIHVDVDRDQHLWAPALRTFKKMHQEPAG
ncbi:MAG: thiamine pyrophosphate-binding protein [Nitriliruptorales bacterium]|nr:thiamine pyrophosphate-binding protein [Nitriliruptorales bacterium]